MGASDASSELIYGTPEPAPSQVAVSVGPFTADISGGAIRGLAWNGVEIVRAIDCPIRDDSWRTATPGDIEETFDEGRATATFRRTFTVMEGALACEVTYQFDARGTVEARLLATASRPVLTNRAGFTVLHPIVGVAGSDVRIRHSDGTIEAATFPALVKASQPAVDMVGIEHRIAGVEVEFAFEGEVFEMEDQRNWSDASYKTYCRPLTLPFPYTIAAGESIEQVIRVSAADAAGSGEDIRPQTDGVARTPTVPEFLVAVDDGWWPDEGGDEIAGLAGCTGVLARLSRRGVPPWLTAAAAGRKLDLEIVVPAGVAPGEFLPGLAADLAAGGIKPGRVMALPEPYLKSYQPDATWPDGPSPVDAAAAAGAAFPEAEIGVGMLTNFTELNRCRPTGDFGDYITHGTTAIVHAADDRSVLETLEALADVFASARQLGGARTYRLGLTAIGMRDNPYGADVAENPAGGRVAMARDDPRHRGLFGAAFAVGLAASASRAGCEALAPAAIAGPFGLGTWSNGTFQPYPLFHVVRGLGRLSGRAPTAMDLPAGVCGLAVWADGAFAAVLANCSLAEAVVEFGRPFPVLVLDAGTAGDAMADPTWIDAAPPTVTGAVTLAPLSTAFVNFGAGSSA